MVKVLPEYATLYAILGNASMHEYDVALKLLLQASADTVLREVTGVRVTRWLNVEMPQVRNARVDLWASPRMIPWCTSNCKALMMPIWLSISCEFIGSTGDTQSKLFCT
jgi:hypothetical protein